MTTNGLPGTLSAKGYELTSMKCDFDLLDLSTLATLHVGRAARAALSQDPYHLIYQLRSHKKFSYLNYLPSLYGHVPCLSDAADCVIARARQIISPHENWEAAVITFYVKASFLHSLLSDQSPNPEVSRHGGGIDRRIDELEFDGRFILRHDQCRSLISIEG